jgi:hypothetical protein
MSFTMIMPNRRSLYIERARQLFQSAKELVLPERFGVPALAYPGSTNTSNAFIRGGPSKEHLSLFDSGPAPKPGTPSRRLMDWKASVDVIEAGEARDPKKTQLEYDEAQRAVSEILKDRRAVHPYLTSEAARMYNNDELVRKHLWHIVVGSLAEDYGFMPGESLKDICNNEAKVSKSLKALVKPSNSAGSPILRDILLAFTRIWNWFKHDQYGDPADRPYWAHFFKRTGVLEGEGFSVLDGGLKFQSARDRLIKYWDLAADYYAKGDRPRAFCALGHAVHLVQDMHVPAHVHNDPHGPTFLLGNLDSLEQWTARGDWPSITRGNGDSNASIWDNGPITPPKADSSWTRDNIVTKLASFVGTIAYKTQQLRSGHVEGIGVTLRGQAKTGPLSDAECYEQARILIPAAILDSAKLIANFVDYVKRDGQPVDAKPA